MCDIAGALGKSEYSRAHEVRSYLVDDTRLINLPLPSCSAQSILVALKNLARVTNVSRWVSRVEILPRVTASRRDFVTLVTLTQCPLGSRLGIIRVSELPLASTTWARYRAISICHVIVVIIMWQVDCHVTHIWLTRESFRKDPLIRLWVSSTCLIRNYFIKHSKEYRKKNSKISSGDERVN